MDDFEKELKLGFLEEVDQLLTESEQCFLGLESNPNDSGILEKIFRIAHNIKGSSKAVGFDHLGHFAHQFENFLLAIKNKKLEPSEIVVSMLLRCNDQIRIMVEELKADFNAHTEVQGLLDEMLAIMEGKASSPVAEETPEAVSEPAEEISVDEIALVQTASMEEALPVGEAVDPFAAPIEVPEPHVAPVAVAPSPLPPTAAAPPAPPANSAQAPPKASAGKPPASEESIRVSLVRLEKLLNFVGELSILQTVLNEQVYGSNLQLLRRTAHQLGKVCKEVQDLSMSLRMVPVKQTFQKMQRIVRDTATTLGKKVNLQLEGEETELDKTVLEAIGDPLVHLIRNAVDHGIESTEDRIANGKSEQGTVQLRAFHQSGKLVIEVADDGGGINGDRLLAKAIEKGILKPGTKLSERDAVHLIFHPGFSTKAQVSEVSGRGVGMDVVKTNIEQLQGEVVVDTVVGKGTTFRIFLPLTLAIIDGMVIENGQDRFVVPLSHVHESLKPGPGELHATTGLGEVLQLRGEVMAAYRLADLLKGAASAKSKKAPEEQIALIIRTSEMPFAILVDDIIRQQQVVVKSLGKELQSVRGYSGSAILGDGRPALILEAFELINSQQSSHRPAASAAPRANSAAQGQHKGVA